MHNSFIASPAVEQYLAPPDPHEKERILPFGVIALIVTIITVILESWLMYAVVQEQLSVGLGILAHILICGVLLAIWVVVTLLPADRLHMSVLLLATIPTGAAGAGGALLANLLCLWFSRFATAFGDWFNTIFPSPEITHAEAVDEDLRTGRDEAGKIYEVTSFMDVLRYGNDDQKRRALSKVTAQFTPGFAPVLKQALADESNMIRVQAATAISIIENRFQERLMKLSNVYKKHGKDPEVVLALANFYDDYSYTGILDRERERENRHRAWELYEEYLMARPEDSGTRTRYGRLLLRLGELDSAIECFERALNEQASPTRAAWLAEAYFRANRINQLRELCRDLVRNYPILVNDMEDSVKHSVQSWAGEEPMVAQEQTDGGHA